MKNPRTLVAALLIGRLLIGNLVTGCGSTSSEPTTKSTVFGEELPSKTGTFALTVQPTSQPKVGANAFLVKFSRPTDAKILSATAFMPAHGHTSDPAQISVDEAGVVHVDHLVLFMPGRWEVTLNVQSQTGVTDTLRFSVSVE